MNKRKFLDAFKAVLGRQETVIRFSSEELTSITGVTCGDSLGMTIMGTSRRRTLYVIIEIRGGRERSLLTYMTVYLGPQRSFPPIYWEPLRVVPQGAGHIEDIEEMMRTLSSIIQASKEFKDERNKELWFATLRGEI